MFHRRAELREAVDASWEVALPLSGLREGEMVGLCLAGREVLLINLGAEGIHAYNNRCPHAGSLLSRGHLEAANLRCPSHLWEFDARTGEGLNPQHCWLRRYPVKVVDGMVLVQARAA
jgi:toluene monooxygenase system ferredoxin subunit